MNYFKNSGKLKAVTFSYDDGTTQDIRLIELLNKYGLRCTFNLNSARLGDPGILWREEQYIAHYKLTAEDVPHVYKDHEVAVHSLNHPDLTTLSEEEIIREVEQDRLNLSELVGYEVVGMAYPCGPNDDRVAGIIKNHTGVKYSRTVTSTYNFDPQQNLYRFNPTVCHLEWEQMERLAHEFVAATPDRPQIFYVWGHAFEMDYAPDHWQKLEEFFRIISEKSDIFYGTNTEVLL